MVVVVPAREAVGNARGTGPPSSGLVGPPTEFLAAALLFRSG